MAKSQVNDAFQIVPTIDGVSIYRHPTTSRWVISKEQPEGKGTYCQHVLTLPLDVTIALDELYFTIQRLTVKFLLETSAQTVTHAAPAAKQ